MSDTKTDNPTGSAFQPDRVKKISLATIGGGRKPSPEEQKAGGAFIGTIMGTANGVRFSQSQTKEGEVVEGYAIVGKFFAEYADGSKAPLQSATLYLPGGFHEAMLDALAPEDATSKERKPNGNVVDFGFEIRCVEAANRAGYSYVITPVHETQKVLGEDDFARLKAVMAKARQAKLASPHGKK